MMVRPMMSKWLQLHSHIREREFLRGKITIPFEFSQVLFSVYQPSRFNKDWFIVLAKCHLETAKQTLSLQTTSHCITENYPVLGMRSAAHGPAHVSLPSNSLINFPAIVSHDYSVISLALNNIFCPKKFYIQPVYLAVTRFDSRQQSFKHAHN